MFDSISHVPTVISSLIVALIIFAILIWISKQISLNDKESFSLNILVCVLGALVGWLLAALFTPFDKTEASKFLVITEGIALFISGFVVSKLDRFLENSLFSENKESKKIWSRIALFVSSLLLTAILVFTVRDYLNFENRIKLKENVTVCKLHLESIIVL